jgi:hypothetical protein
MTENASKLPTNRARDVLITCANTFLFAAYPVLAMLAFNIGEMPASDALRFLLISLVAALLLLLIMRLILKDWAKASLVSTGGLILFYSYGHIYDLVRKYNIAETLLGKHKFLLPFWLVLFGIWFWWVVARLKKTRQATNFFNILGVVLVVMPLFMIVSQEVRDARYQVGQNSRPSVAQAADTGERPDIYYIILDGHARSDVLQELYDYDNSEFIKYLTDKGFYVATQSTSNYIQTALSLASSLNMEYLDELAATQGVDNNDRSPLAEMIFNSKLRDYLAGQGYKLVAFQTGYGRSSIRSADIFWSVDKEAVPQISSLWRVNAFESLFLETTALRAAFDSQYFSRKNLRKLTNAPEFQAHREMVLYELQRLDDPASMPGDYFVFAHIIIPHPPFVFGPNGEQRTPNTTHLLGDGDEYRGRRDEYIQGYRDQAKFIDSQIEPVIDSILSKSKTPPIIIIQADHGPGAYLIWESPEQSNLKERFSILNAYYLPGGGEADLYPTITPVNSFRIVLNRLFGAGFDLLPDKNYFTTWKRPYEFIDVTNQLQSP